MTAAPIARLPSGPVTTVRTQRGALVAVALPRQEDSTGFVWRLAREVNGRVARQVAEADVGESVVVVFEAVATGTATIAFALTRGESSAEALRALSYEVEVS